MSRKQYQREPTEEELSVISAVRHCAREIDDMLQGARRQGEKNMEVFVQTNINMLWRAVKCYAGMFERLEVRNREDLDVKLGEMSRCEAVQDAQDDLLETEGVWRNLISNMQREVKLSLRVTLKNPPKEGDKLDWSRLTDLVDSKHQRPASLQELAKKHNSLFVYCQPAYLSGVAIKWHLDQIAKVESDLKSFGVGFAVITWGCRDHGKRWAKDLKVKHPVFLDITRSILKMFEFEWGLDEVWGPDTLQFFGEMTRASRAVSLPPLDLLWDESLHLGGAVMLTSSGRVLLLHASCHPGDLPSSANIAKKALTAYAKAMGKTEEEVLSSKREEGRLKIPPDEARFQLEPSSGMYYDPETRLYYDPRSKYYYDGDSGHYVYWDSDQAMYVSADHMYAQGAAHLTSVLQSVQGVPGGQEDSYSVPQSSTSTDTYSASANAYSDSYDYAYSTVTSETYQAPATDRIVLETPLSKIASSAEDDLKPPGT